jgi:hypothetical protein
MPEQPHLVRKRAVVVPLSDPCKVVLYDLIETIDQQLAQLPSGHDQQAAALNLIAHLVFFTGSMVRASESNHVLDKPPTAPYEG